MYYNTLFSSNNLEKNEIYEENLPCMRQKSLAFSTTSVKISGSNGILTHVSKESMEWQGIFGTLSKNYLVFSAFYHLSMLVEVTIIESLNIDHKSDSKSWQNLFDTYCLFALHCCQIKIVYCVHKDMFRTFP